jgi:aminomethyltransferase
MTIHTTIFNQKHKEAGARMVSFAGFEMPLEYEGVTAEHMQVRNRVGVFDVSHMGEIWVKGKDAFQLVQKITSNDVSLLEKGKIQYSCLMNQRGGIVDDLLVYKYEDDKYLLVVNAANTEKDYKWISHWKSEHVEVEDASDSISQLAVQGPKAQAVLQKLTQVDLEQISYYHFQTIELAGIKEVIVSRTGYTGAGGFELYFYNEDGPKLWDAIFEAGKDEEIKPVGLAARDTLRLEMGYCLYGNDIGESTTPLEAGLGWVTKFTQGNDFLGREILEDLKTRGVNRLLRGFVMEDRCIPRQGYEILDEKGRVLGLVSSGTMSPVLKQGIGLCYIRADHSAIDTPVYVSVREKMLKGKITKIPFV